MEDWRKALLVLAYWPAGALYAILRILPFSWAKEAAWDLWFVFHDPEDLLQPINPERWT